MADKKLYKVCATYDTETTTLGHGPSARAFVYAYILNDLREVPISTYRPGADDHVKIVKHLPDVLDFIADLVEWGLDNGITPIIAAYNLMFDMQTLMAALAERYTLKCVAQSSTHVYFIDVCEHDTNRTVLRFWDTFFLDMNGLASMGKTAGLPKAVGDLDYSLVRHAQTPITETERGYMLRDVQVIPAYLRWLLESNQWMPEKDLGVRVLTKSGVVRQMAIHKIYNLKIPGKKYSLGYAFEQLCQAELPPDFQTLALRTACFRGGLTFTAARNASVCLQHVGSWDVTSMHHQYINGRRIPVRWRKGSPGQLRLIAGGIVQQSMEDVLSHYDKPHALAINAMIAFTNIRLRKGSAFEYYGIAILAEGKFKQKETVDPNDLSNYAGNEATAEAENALRSKGWLDTARGATFAFGKLYRADYAEVCLTEVELWNVSQVYEWDEMVVIGGEYSAASALPPDYVSLLSNMLFEEKSDVKEVLAKYDEGNPYPGDVPATIPENIADGLRTGTISTSFMESYYKVNTKGPFNAIYGIQAMQLWRNDFLIDDTGTVHVDADTTPNEDNFADRAPSKPRSLYTYGTRIVGGSRQHLVIAIELIYKAFGDKAQITGGDTDSMKIALDPSISVQDVNSSLEPLHAACRVAKDAAQARIRKNYPDLASDLAKIGEFDFEPAIKAKPKKGIEQVDFYDEHMELWNKARVSMVNGHTHVTFAGVSRPDRPKDFDGVAYNIEEFMDALIAKGYTFEEVVNACCGYNSQLSYNVAHMLMRSRPATTDYVDEDVTDYLGNTMHVHAPEAQALYPIWKTVGDTNKFDNAASVAFLAKHWGRTVDDRDKYVDVAGPDRHPRVQIGNAHPVILE